jgi:CBS domain-containing protein
MHDDRSLARCLPRIVKSGRDHILFPAGIHDWEFTDELACEFMKKNESVAKVMSSELVTVDQSEPVSKARQRLESGEFHHLPVVRGDDLVGIISSNDILRVTFGEYGDQDGRSLDAMLDHTYQLSEVMNSNPSTLQKNSTVRDAALMLENSRFHSLPVVDGSKLIGIVTSTDLIRYLVDQY